MSDLIEPPEGCMEIPGFILIIKGGDAWFTKTGEVTKNFGERGVWETKEDADRAQEIFTA